MGWGFNRYMKAACVRERERYYKTFLSFLHDVIIDKHQLELSRHVKRRSVELILIISEKIRLKFLTANGLNNQLF